LKENNSPIYVTKPILLIFKEFHAHVKNILTMKQPRNNVDYFKMLKHKFAEDLSTKFICMFSNKTHALISTQKAFESIATTPRQK